MLSCASLSRRKRPERFEARREAVLKSTESRRSNRLLIAATEADFLVFLKVFGCWRRLQLRNRRARYAPGKSKVFLPIHRSHCRDSLHTTSTRTWLPVLASARSRVTSLASSTSASER
jgi:hypothetical protein